MTKSALIELLGVELEPKAELEQKAIFKKLNFANSLVTVTPWKGVLFLFFAKFGFSQIVQI